MRANNLTLKFHKYLLLMFSGEDDSDETVEIVMTESHMFEISPATGDIIKSFAFVNLQKVSLISSIKVYSNKSHHRFILS